MFSFITKSIVRVFNSVVLASILVGLGIFSVVIGAYNYESSMGELRDKTKNAGDLATIALREAIWNFDEAGLQDILTGMLLDVDVVGIRVTSGKEAKTTAEKKRDAFKAVEFPELLKNPSHLSTVVKVKREGKEIAQVQIISSTERVQASIRTTTILIFVFAMAFVLALSLFIWFLGKRIIQRPINSLRESADHLAGGNLNQQINVERKDELGSLAVSFDKMRNAIRKKLADLAILNNTGEKLAGIHDQALALETAIKVMSEQTHVERGSIYLLDRDQNLTLNAFFPHLTDDTSEYPKSFKLGEGVIGNVATTGKVAFFEDVSKVSDYVAASASDSPKSLLCVPMMDDKEVFGVMNFIGEVGKVDFTKDDEGFALTIARMVVITIKNIQMLAVIEEQNRTLEERILERTAQLRQKTNDVSNMLQNMRQGIFTIVIGGEMHPEYSAYLTEIFETKDIANRSVFSFLFEQSNVGTDALSQMAATVDSMIGEDSMMFEFNSHLLVHEYTKHFSDDRSKILELDWNAVLDSDGIIDKLMVTVRDVTELKALQLETEKQKEELNIIGQILAVSRTKLLEFVSTSYEFFDENKALIEKHEDKDPEVLATLFRNMHTVKGNARTYGMTYITDRVHEAESTYAQLRSDDECLWNQAQLLQQLQAARDCVARYDTVFKEKLAGFSGGDGDSFSKAVIDKIARAVDEVNELSQVAALRNSLLSIKSSINTVRSESVSGVLGGILNGIPSMARQLEKETPVVKINDNFIRIKNDVVPMLRNIFMHVFRNSMDHGLETTEQRLSKGKPEFGNINLDVSLTDDQLTFTYSDDGKGLALEHIYKKALSNGQLSSDQQVTDEQIAQLVFLSGLSTAEVVTNLSGRGVGMDAIKKFLNKHHGDIQLVFTEEAASGGFRPFKQIITLPAKYAIHQGVAG